MTANKRRVSPISKPKPVYLENNASGSTVVVEDDQEKHTLSEKFPTGMVPLRNYMAHCFAHLVFKTRDIPDFQLTDMGEAQFEAFCRSALEDDAQ